jgi:hypothetical protein
VNGVTQIFHRAPDGKDVSDVQQVLDIRRFLTSADRAPGGSPMPGHAPAVRRLVVINQQETLIFRCEGAGSAPERLHPYDPEGLLHHLKHTLGEDMASRLPENLAYYQEIAATLSGADEVLLMGNGTGASSAMAHLRHFLEAHNPDIAGTVVGALTIDLESMTEGQLMREARAFFSHEDRLAPT